ncbi:MAG: class I SAM-dependent methyltransferase [Thermoplasmata archaeon]|nr:class I SAM-dependent methyltransferase [Thermoplasmata archaeon]
MSGSPGSIPTGTGELPSDFRTLDFGTLWRGRERTTHVEGEILATALRSLPTARVVELGTGEGRLAPVVRRVAGEYIGVDQRLAFLERLRDRARLGARSLLVEANLYHLPLIDAAATSAVLARVYNFLPDPAAALREIWRALVPGGGLVLSCSPHPSWLTIVDDFRVALARPAGTPMRSMTFSRAPVVAVHPSSFPATSPTRTFLASTVREAGFRVDRVFGTGLEDSRWTRVVPPGAFVIAGRELGAAPIFPLHWLVARTVPAEEDRPPPPLERSIACPRCRRPFGTLDLDHAFALECEQCRFPVRMERGILRARYVAP